MQLPLLKPDAYQAEGTAAVPGAPALLGAECDACGYVFFPAQMFGCERCGAHGALLKPRALAGRGTLTAAAAVHLHPGKRPLPFVVGTVRLLDGPSVRTLLAEGSERLAPGQLMRTMLAPTPDSETGETKLDLRFAPE